MIKAISVVTLLLALAACEGPFGITSGGELSGTVEDPPAVWQLGEDSGLAQLETRPGDPYSVNLAYVQLDGHLYVYAGDTRTNWVEHIEQSPLVRILIEETLYPARAVRVSDDVELAAFAAQWTSRGTFQRDPMQFDEVWLYRLEPR